MKFRIGDIVKCIDDCDVENGVLYYKETYEILDVFKKEILIRDGDGCEEWFSINRFELLERIKPQTELEFLDAFQRNFAEGI